METEPTKISPDGKSDTNMIIDDEKASDPTSDIDGDDDENTGPCTCYLCNRSTQDSILMKRGDEELTAGVVMKKWKASQLSKELTFRDENATLGNLLGDRAQQDPRVRYSASKIEHPTDTHVQLLVDVKKEAVVAHRSNSALDCNTSTASEAAHNNAHAISYAASLICADVVQEAAAGVIRELITLSRCLKSIGVENGQARI